MHSLTVRSFTLLVLLSGCGGAKAKDANTEATDTASTSSETGSEKLPAKAREDEPKSNASMCMGANLDLSAALIQVACELPEGKAGDGQGGAMRDLKGQLDVKVGITPAKVPPGGHADVVITYKNLKQGPLTLDFMLDPTPRFTVEAYDAKGVKRVDMPAGHEPPPPKDAVERPASPQSTARITLAPGGMAHMRVGWDAVRTKWAPEKYKGTPPEMGYPRSPNGPLPKGKYRLCVATPLINVLEGGEHEWTIPHLDVEVGN